MKAIVQISGKHVVVETVATNDYAAKVHGDVKIFDLHRHVQGMPRGTTNRPNKALVASAMAKDPKRTVGDRFRGIDSRGDTTPKTTKAVLEALAAMTQDPILLEVLEE